MKKLVVLCEFVDKDDFSKKYNVGDTVEFIDESRIEKLVALGLCGVEDENKDDGKADGKINIFEKDYNKNEIIEALKECGVSVAWNISSVKLTDKVNELDEEIVMKLKEFLEKE